MTVTVVETVDKKESLRVTVTAPLPVVEVAGKGPNRTGTLYAPEAGFV